MVPFIHTSRSFLGPSRIPKRVLGGSGGGSSPAAGLTLIDSAEVSGGAVSSLSITVNLEAGKSYRIGMAITGTNTYAGDSLLINSDSTAANYRRGYFLSSGSSADDSNLISVDNPGSGLFSAYYGGANLLNSTPSVNITGVYEAGSARAWFESAYSATESTLAVFTISRPNAGLADGTWLKCWRLD